MDEAGEASPLPYISLREANAPAFCSRAGGGGGGGGGGRHSWARIIILVGEGPACAQGYNLNCKKIKQFLISFIAVALRVLFTFIFISATS